MNVKDETILLYRTLDAGLSLAGELCPRCKGGRTGEHTLSVARYEDNTLVWNCHRASCGFKGRDSTRASNPEAAASKPPTKTRELPEVTSLVRIPEKARELLRTKYFFTDEHLELGRLGWTNELARTIDAAGRLYVPVFNWKGVRDGYILRSLTGDKPKALTFVKSGSMCWYHKDNCDKVVIVEDQLSAIRLSKYVTAIALLGTNLNSSRVHEILSAKARDYYLWLDGDAFNLAVKYALRFKGEIKFNITKLTKDIKDLDEEELKQLLTEEGMLDETL